MEHVTARSVFFQVDGLLATGVGAVRQHLPIGIVDGVCQLGGLVTLAGLVLAFWLQPRSVWTVRKEKGWTVYGRCRKGGALFTDELKKAAAGAGFRIYERQDSDAGTGEKAAEGENK